MSTGTYTPPDNPITPEDIVEGRVSVIELFNRETRQNIHIYWNGHVEGLDENWLVKNLLPSRQMLARFVHELIEADHIEDKPARHLMAVPVTVELLMEMIREGYRGGAECTQGIPVDAVLVSSSIKTEANGAQAAHLIFEHKSFPLVEPGAEIPTKQIIFFRVRLEGESKFDPLAPEQ